MSLKTTPFYELHKRHNARMVPLGRWLMPLQYTHIRDEHLAVRRKAGLFDASHMGNILVTGKDAEKFSDRLLTNQIGGRKPFRAVYGMFCNERGGIIDDLIVYKYNRDKLMFVVNAGCADKDLHWMKHQSFSSTFYDVKIQDQSEETCILALQGPESLKILEKPLRKKGEFRNLQRFSFYDDTLSSVPVTVARTGYTGENGYEIYFNRKHARQVWDILMKEGRPFGLTLCGIGARDSLRLEKCYPLYGNEISETVNPIEADLKWAVSFRKDFIGRKALEALKTTERRLVAFTMLEDRVPRHGYPILSQEEKEIGVVTSGGISFTMGKNIGMGYVPAAYARWDLPVKIRIRGKIVPAKIIKPPFVADRKN